VNFCRGIPKEKLQKLILVGILTLIAVIGAGNFYVAKQFSIWSTSRRRIVDIRRQIQEAEQHKQQAVQSQQLRTQVIAFVQSQQETMVSGDLFAWVVRSVSLLAEQHPVRVLGMRPGSKAKHELKSRYEVYTTQLELEATYDQLGIFLQDLEVKFPTAEIRRLDLAAGDGNRPERRASLELAFLIRPDTSPNKVGAKLKGDKKES
jgi:hypothetical protein